MVMTSLWLLIGPSDPVAGSEMGCPGEYLLGWFSLAIADLCLFLEYILCAWLLLRTCLGPERGWSRRRWQHYSCPWVAHNLPEIVASRWQLAMCQGRSPEASAYQKERPRGYSPEE